MSVGSCRHLPSQLDEGSALDVTVISTLQLILVGAASTLGHSLRVREERKMAAHAEACCAVGVLFVPLVVESVGRWSDEAIHPIASIGHLQGQCLVIPPSERKTPLPAIGHLAIERERHTVDLPPASPSCQRGWTDLTDLVTSLFIYFIMKLYIICFCCFYALHHLLNAEL